MEFVSPYDNLAFRRLGLSASASWEEIEEQLASLRRLIEEVGNGQKSEQRKISLTKDKAEPEEDWLGTCLSCRAGEELLERVGATNFPWLEAVQLDQAGADAIEEELKNDSVRLMNRVFWYHCQGKEDEQAIKFIHEGQAEKAIKLWIEVGTSASAAAAVKASALHNLAILYHTRAYAAPRGKECAQQDLKEAARWWNRVLEGKFLPFILSDGESFEAYILNGGADDEDPGPAQGKVLDQARDLIPKIYRYIPQLLSFERCQLSGQYDDGARQVNLAKDNVALPVEMDVRDYQETKARISVALSEADYCTAHCQFQQASRLIEEARSEVNTDEIALLNSSIFHIENRRVVRGLLPVTDVPKLSSRVAFGFNFGRLRNFDEKTRSFSARLAWTFFFIPLWYIARYRVRQEVSGRWIFMGRYAHDSLISVYNFMACILLIVVLITVLVLGMRFGLSVDVGSSIKA
ncbi:MAG: hypothetical protein ACI38Q_07055 [Candidatus Bruticola sp.]